MLTPGEGVDELDARLAPALRSWRLRLLTVGLPAVLAGSFEFLRPAVMVATGLRAGAADLIMAGLALVGGLIYFQTVATLVSRLSAEAERAGTDRRVLAQRLALADDLHDSLSQTLFFLHVRLQRMPERVGREAPVRLAQEVSEAAAATEEAYLEVRETIRRLQEEGADGLAREPEAEALDRLAATVLRDGDLALVVEARGEARRYLEPQRWAAVQSILLEALRNVRKHGRADRVRLWLDELPRGGVAGVEDDGCGFDPSLTGGFGLASMRRRAAQAGLDLSVESRLGGGTRVEVGWQVDQEVVGSDPLSRSAGG